MNSASSNSHSRFHRTSSTAPSSNRFSHLSRACVNFFRTLVNFFHLLGYTLVTVNTTLSSLQSFFRRAANGISTICLRLNAIYRGFLILFESLFRLLYPIICGIQLIVYVITQLVTLPVRILNFILRQFFSMLRVLLLVSIVLGIILGLICLVSDDQQRTLIKVFVQNASETILHYSNLWK